MPSKWELLEKLNVKKLKELANENSVSLVTSGFFGDSTASLKSDIIEILDSSSKISIKKIQDKISGKTSSKIKSSNSKKVKRMRILAADRSEILERQKGKCDVCGKQLDLIHKLYEIDHKNALADGGIDTIDNYHALCLECHRKKTRKETSKRAKTKRQSSVATKTKAITKVTYKCKLSTSDRKYECGKKDASSSCLKVGFFDNKCDYLTISRK